MNSKKLASAAMAGSLVALLAVLAVAVVVPKPVEKKELSPAEKPQQLVQKNPETRTNKELFLAVFGIPVPTNNTERAYAEHVVVLHLLTLRSTQVALLRASESGSRLDWLPTGLRAAQARYNKANELALTFGIDINKSEHIQELLEQLKIETAR